MTVYSWRKIQNLSNSTQLFDVWVLQHWTENKKLAQPKIVHNTVCLAAGLHFWWQNCRADQELLSSSNFRFCPHVKGSPKLIISTSKSHVNPLNRWGIFANINARRNKRTKHRLWAFWPLGGDWGQLAEHSCSCKSTAWLKLLITRKSKYCVT